MLMADSLSIYEEEDRVIVCTKFAFYDERSVFRILSTSYTYTRTKARQPIKKNERRRRDSYMVLIARLW